MSLTSIKDKNYYEIVECFENAFDGFAVCEPGILPNENILFLIEEMVAKEISNNFQIQLCAGLEAIGVKINNYLTIIVDNMENEEFILRRILNYSDLKYFLMIGENSHYHAVMKSVKLKADIRGNYKDYRKVINHEGMFKLVLEINRQCRGINYPCPADFPTEVAFFHFIFSDHQITCGTNALKFEPSHKMVPHSFPIEKTKFIQELKHLCSKITGRTEHKTFFKKLVITFENYLSTKLSDEIALMLYEAVENLNVHIGVAEIELFKPFKPIARRNGIKSCLARKYENDLNSNKILEMLELCRNCNEQRLKMDEKSVLPEQIKIAAITHENIRYNYENLRCSTSFYDSEDDECLVLDVPRYPKIKYRNQVTNVKDFTIA